MPNPIDALELLQERNRQFEQILETVPGGIVHVGGDGAILVANSQAKRFLGLTYDELSRRFVVDFAGATFNEDGSVCPPADYPVTRCMVTGEPQPPRVIGVVQPGGEVRWASFTAMPLMSQGGRGAVVTFIDITERKRDEESRRRMADRLQVADRLASVGTLASGVAHEINNPLTYVLGNLDQAIDDPDTSPAELAALLEDAREGARRIAGIVRTLGRFARVGAPGEVFQVEEAIRVAGRMAQLDMRHRARLSVDVDAHLPLAAGEETRATQVMLNLLANAAHAIPAGRYDENLVRVEARLDGAYIVVSVQDTGEGMSEAALSSAFDPFYTTKDVGEGTGLGLSSAHHIVRRMGGDLRLQSVLGGGTTATLRFRVASGAAAERAASVPAASQRAGRLSVLVVDDEPGVRRTLRYALRQHDLSVVANATDALEMCEKVRFDAILCDVMMPERTGVEFHMCLAERDPEAARRVVFMSGGATTSETRDYLARVDNPLVDKPFSLARLLAELRAAADR